MYRNGLSWRPKNPGRVVVVSLLSVAIVTRAFSKFNAKALDLLDTRTSRTHVEVMHAEAMLKSLHGLPESGTRRGATCSGQRVSCPSGLSGDIIEPPHIHRPLEHDQGELNCTLRLCCNVLTGASAHVRLYLLHSGEGCTDAQVERIDGGGAAVLQVRGAFAH